MKNENSMKCVEIYTDGGCKGNPGVGGWGVVLKCEGKEKHLKGADAYTTNNKMELKAAIEALKALKMPCRIELYTDSVYLKNGITQWIKNWKRKHWKTANKEPVKNQDLWQELDRLSEPHLIKWHWVKGHADNLGNELADNLANQAIEQYLGR